MIQAENLTKSFDDFIAVSQLSLEVHPGEVMALLGPNGAGKTTTVRMFTSILVPTSGRATIMGFDVVRDADRVRSSVGVLTEHHGLYGRMNAEEYLDFFGKLYRLEPTVRVERREILLEKFGLKQDRKKRLGDYSKGMRQKLALVRALLHDPPVLLLDEPTSAMDPESAHIVRNTISSLRAHDRAILICTHNLQEAEELADKVAIIKNGRILICDTPAGIKSQVIGPPEFQASVNGSLDGWMPETNPGVQIIARGSDWIRFQVERPEESNPVLLQQMVHVGLRVTTFSEIQHSLDEAYLKIVGRMDENGKDH